MSPCLVKNVVKFGLEFLKIFTLNLDFSDPPQKLLKDNNISVCSKEQKFSIPISSCFPNNVIKICLECLKICTFSLDFSVDKASLMHKNIAP